MTADTEQLRRLRVVHGQDDEPLTAERYTTVFRQHPAGVAVITLVHKGRPVGFTATSVISVSVAPPFLAFSLAHTSSSWPGDLGRQDSRRELPVSRPGSRVRPSRHERHRPVR